MSAMMKQMEAMRNKRSVTLGIRFSPEERAAIERAAARQYRSLSSYLRYVALKALVEESRDDGNDQKQNPAA